jgi:hypothetical protein
LDRRWIAVEAKNGLLIRCHIDSAPMEIVTQWYLYDVTKQCVLNIDQRTSESSSEPVSSSLFGSPELPCNSILNDVQDKIRVPLIVTSFTDAFRKLATRLMRGQCVNMESSKHQEESLGKEGMSIAALAASKVEDKNMPDTTISPSPPITILEIGCSTGGNLDALWLASDISQKSFTWIGFDNSTEMVQSVQTKINARQQQKQQKQQPRPDRIPCTLQKGRFVKMPDLISNSHRDLFNNIPRHDEFVFKIDVFNDPVNATQIVTELMYTVSSPDSQILILVDIGGNRAQEAVFLMIDWVANDLLRRIVIQKYCTRFSPMILVKSEEIVTSLHCFYSDMSSTTMNPLCGNNTSPQVQNDKLTITTTGSQYNSTDLWFRRMAWKARCSRFPKHPLKAPKVPSPVNASICICRYHNYNSNGCLRYNHHLKYGQCSESTNNHDLPNRHDGQHLCPFDHEHCHWCLNVGHVALSCPHRWRNFC